MIPHQISDSNCFVFGETMTIFGKTPSGLDLRFGEIDKVQVEKDGRIVALSGEKLVAILLAPSC